MSIFLVSLPLLGFGVASVLTAHALNERLLGGVVASMGLAGAVWAMWRDTVSVAKAAVVLMLFVTAPSAISFMQPGMPWPFIAALTTLCACWWMYVAPPGRQLPHQLLDTGSSAVFEVEGVHFTLSVPTSFKHTTPLVLGVHAENCWTAARTLEFELGGVRTAIKLEAGESKRGDVAFPVGQFKVEPPSMLTATLDVRAKGWSGRRQKPRRGRELKPVVKPHVAAAMLLTGVLVRGGGIRITTRLER